LTVDAETANEATEIVKKMCDDLRIFNPIVSDCKVSISDQYK
jgi:phosphoribosylformylglycinamidine (FGAM) synthase PurS component